MKIGMACYKADDELKSKIKDYLESKGHKVVDYTLGQQELYLVSNDDNPVSLGINEQEFKYEDLMRDMNHTDQLTLNELPKMYATYNSSPFVQFGFILIPIRAFYHWSEKLLIQQISSRISKRDYIRATFKLSKITHKGLKKLRKLINCIKNS